MSSNCEVEPGVSSESILVTANSFDNLDQMTSSLEEIKSSNGTKTNENDTHLKNSNSIDNFEEPSCSNSNNQDDDYLRNDDWLNKHKHVFVLSSAGKPIYSRYGNEDKLATLFGVMQALVSFLQDQDDSLQSIDAGNTKFVFLAKNNLILVTVSKTGESSAQLLSQLNYVFYLIASILTLTKLNKIFEQRRNYDLRRLLSGAERLIDHLLDFSEREPGLTLGAIQCLPLPSTARNTISGAITQACSKIKNLVFAILLANNKLITLVRMKKYCIHPADLHLIFNLVQASESFKNSESWTPLCLPRFDGSGFLYTHVSYLAEDCQACLLLLTVEPNVFFTLSEAKQKIVEKLRRTNCLEAINESLKKKIENCSLSGLPEIRHYLYKCKSTAQFHQPSISAPYTSDRHILNLYKYAHKKIHHSTRPLKLLFEKTKNEVILAWDTKTFELYVILEPLTSAALANASVGRLLNWLKTREDTYFHLSAPTF